MGPTHLLLVYYLEIDNIGPVESSIQNNEMHKKTVTTFTCIKNHFVLALCSARFCTQKVC